VNASFSLGRIAGIRIGVNWTWLVAFALISWSLAETVFPSQNEGLSDGVYLAMALAATVLFFVSLLAHELGHAFAARREGMEIEGIVLWLFGGVAQFRGVFPSARAEFLIAVAGPLVSLAIGAGALAAALLPLPEAVDGVLAWLGFINLFLLLFNLLPALPLDGGRVLRAALWRARGDFEWATGVAAGIGRGFGYLLVGAGVAILVLASTFSGIWLAFLGWFLLGAAGAEARFVAVREALVGLRVRDLMAREPATVEAGLTLGALLDEIVPYRRFTTYPVVDGGRVVGLLPFRRVAEVPRSDWDARTVRDCMLPRGEVVQLRPETPVVDALQELGAGSVGRALVLEGEELVGLLSLTDVARALELRGFRRRNA
jgi:Zn-dependent protease/CBS domain-containing protein